MKHRVLIGLILVLSLSACNKTIIEEPKEHEPFPTFPTTQEIPFEEPHGTVSVADSSPIYTQCQLNYVSAIINPISVNGATVTFEAFAYEGLKDKTVEALFNQKIVDKMKSFSKYTDIKIYQKMPGFKTLYPGQNNTIKQVYVYAKSSFCYNNILSIQFAASVRINSDNYDFVVSEALNLDMNTGDEVNLSDLFINGSDFETRLNELILNKAQSQTEAHVSVNNEGIDQFRYLGGFTGIRGDVGFFLTYDMTIVLLFDDSYPEFYNQFGTSVISVSMSELKDILALGQRFVHSEVSLFTDPKIDQINNYLYVSPYEFTLKYEKINNIRVRESVTFYKDFNEPFKSLQTTLLEELKAKISSITESGITNVSLTFSASPNGDTMNVRGFLYYSDKVVPMLGTYRADGSQLTLEDVFVDGFDYRTYFKEEIQKIITDSHYENTYDLDQVLDTLIPTFMVHSFDGVSYLTLTNEFFQDFTQDEGDFWISIIMTNHPEMFKNLPW